MLGVGGKVTLKPLLTLLRPTRGVVPTTRHLPNPRENLPRQVGVLGVHPLGRVPRAMPYPDGTGRHRRRGVVALTRATTSTKPPRGDAVPASRPEGSLVGAITML